MSDSKIKIKDLATELKMDAKELLQELQSMGFNVKSAQGSIPMEEVSGVRDRVAENRQRKADRKDDQPTVIVRRRRVKDEAPAEEQPQRNSVVHIVKVPVIAGEVCEQAVPRKGDGGHRACPAVPHGYGPVGAGGVDRTGVRCALRGGAAAVSGVANVQPLFCGDYQPAVLHREDRGLDAGFLFHIRGPHIARAPGFRHHRAPLVAGAIAVGEPLSRHSFQNVHPLVQSQGGQLPGLGSGLLPQRHPDAGDAAVILRFPGGSPQLGPGGRVPVWAGRAGGAGDVRENGEQRGVSARRGSLG